MRFSEPISFSAADEDDAGFFLRALRRFTEPGVTVVGEGAAEDSSALMRVVLILGGVSGGSSWRETVGDDCEELPLAGEADELFVPRVGSGDALPEEFSRRLKRGIAIAPAVLLRPRRGDDSLGGSKRRGDLETCPSASSSFILALIYFWYESVSLGVLRRN